MELKTEISCDFIELGPCQGLFCIHEYSTFIPWVMDWQTGKQCSKICPLQIIVCREVVFFWLGLLQRRSALFIWMTFILRCFLWNGPDLHNNRHQKIRVYKFYRLYYGSEHKAFWIHWVFERDWIAVFKNAWKCECADSPAGAWMWCMDTLLSSEWFWMWCINRRCLRRHRLAEEVMAPFHRMLITLLRDDELV